MRFSSKPSRDLQALAITLHPRGPHGLIRASPPACSSISAHSLLLGLVVKIEAKRVKTSEPAAARCTLLALFLLSGSNQTLAKPSGKASADFGDCPELLPQTWDRCVRAQMNFPQRQSRFVSSWAPPAPREALSISSWVQWELRCSASPGRCSALGRMGPFCLVNRSGS